MLRDVTTRMVGVGRRLTVLVAALACELERCEWLPPLFEDKEVDARSMLRL